MKKLILIAMATLMLTACQPTPEQAIVVEKDTERMVEQAMPESTEQAIPTISELVPEDRYFYEETGADGKLTLTMDAEIDVPDVDYMPITEVSKDIFTQEQVSKMFNYFFPSGEATIDMPQVELKSDIERGILETKQELAKTEDATQRKVLLEEIAWLEECYLEVPEEQPAGGISDGTLMTSFMGSEYGLELSVFDETGRLRVNTGADAQNPANYNSLYYSGARPELEDLEGDVKSITREDSDAALEAFMSEMEINMDDFYIVSDPSVYTDLNGEEITSMYNYNLGRMVGDVPCFIDHNHELSRNYGGRTHEETVFSVPWGYEYFEIRIDSEGIGSVNWDSPMLVGENVTDNALLKSFDEIANIYENMLMTEYEGFTKTVLEGEYDVHVTTKSAQLKLLNIRVQGEEFEGIYVPAWIFYGGVTIKNPAGDERYFGAGAKQFNGIISDVNEGRVIFNVENEMEEFLRDENAYVFKYIGSPIAKYTGIPDMYYNAYDMPMMAINAVDGSIIDWLNGY